MYSVLVVIVVGLIRTVHSTNAISLLGQCQLGTNFASITYSTWDEKKELEKDAACLLGSRPQAGNKFNLWMEKKGGRRSKNSGMITTIWSSTYCVCLPAVYMLGSFYTTWRYLSMSDTWQFGHFIKWVRTPQGKMRRGVPSKCHMSNIAWFRHIRVQQIKWALTRHSYTFSLADLRTTYYCTVMI